jgi:hypothetical protein
LTQQFTAIGTYSDGTTKDITASVIWISGDTRVATIAVGGLATCGDVGTVGITASSGGVTSSPGSLLTCTVQIYIADSSNDRIVRIDDLGGTNWTTFGIYGTGANQFIVPRGVFVDTAGKIYVTDAGNNRIVRIDDMSGANWTTFGTLGAGTNQFVFPSSVFLDTSGKIYVTDHSRVVRIDDLSGTNWTEFGTLGSGVNQFRAASKIFVR